MFLRKEKHYLFIFFCLVSDQLRRADQRSALKRSASMTAASFVSYILCMLGSIVLQSPPVRPSWPHRVWKEGCRLERQSGIRKHFLVKVCARVRARVFVNKCLSRDSRMWCESSCFWKRSKAVNNLLRRLLEPDRPAESISSYGASATWSQTQNILGNSPALLREGTAVSLPLQF